MKRSEALIVKSMLKTSRLLLLAVLTGCASKSQYAVECIDFSSDAPVKLIDLAQGSAKREGLEFRDLGDEGKLTGRQKKAGEFLYLVTDGKVNLVFNQTDFGATKICAYDETNGVDRQRVITIVEQIKKELGERGVSFTTPPTKPKTR